MPPVDFGHDPIWSAVTFAVIVGALCLLLLHHITKD